MRRPILEGFAAATASAVVLSRPPSHPFSSIKVGYAKKHADLSRRAYNYFSMFAQRYHVEALNKAHPLPSGEGSGYVLVRTKVCGVGESARPALGPVQRVFMLFSA